MLLQRYTWSPCVGREVPVPHRLLREVRPRVQAQRATTAVRLLVTDCDIQDSVYILAGGRRSRLTSRIGRISIYTCTVGVTFRLAVGLAFQKVVRVEDIHTS